MQGDIYLSIDHKVGGMAQDASEVAAKRAEIATQYAVDNPTDHSVHSSLRKVTDAIDWYESRGAGSVNVPLSSLKELQQALEANNWVESFRLAMSIYTREMHPTADDIVGGAARQTVYTLTDHKTRAHQIKSTWE